MSKYLNSTKSYRCLQWNSQKKDERESLSLPIFAQINSKKQSSKTFHKLKQLNYEQNDVEDKYRCINDKKFKFSPTTFSVDCQHNAYLVHRNLLNLSGSDEIILNNPNYFDSLSERINFIEDLKISQQENARIKKEKYRIMLENMYLRSDPRKQSSLEPEIFKNRKFYDDFCRNSTKDCENFIYENRKKSCDSTLSDCERFDYNSLDYPVKKLDYLDEETSLESIYKKADQFIKNKLLAPPEEKIKPMNFPTELGISRNIESREAIAVLKKLLSRHLTDLTSKSQLNPKPVDFTTCGCKRKK